MCVKVCMLIKHYKGSLNASHIFAFHLMKQWFPNWGIALITKWISPCHLFCLLTAYLFSIHPFVKVYDAVICVIKLIVGCYDHCSSLLGPDFQVGYQHSQCRWLLETTWKHLLPSAMRFAPSTNPKFHFFGRCILLIVQKFSIWIYQRGEMSGLSLFIDLQLLLALELFGHATAWWLSRYASITVLTNRETSKISKRSI